jgi:hypothetical protein
MGIRLISPVAIALAAAFLAVASNSFTSSASAELAFGIGISTPLVSLGLARHHHHHHIPTRVIGVLTIAVSAWTIGASLVLAEPALASSPATSASGNGQPTGPAGRRR